MKEMNNKFKIILIFILFFAFFLSSYNAFFNGHYHTDENGHVIFHAHPYASGENSSSPVKKHSHTKTQFVIYEILTNLLFSLFITLFIFLFFLPQINKRKIKSVKIFSPFDLFSSVHLRAPPVLLHK